MRIRYEEVQKTLYRVFKNIGLSNEKAEICARIHSQTSLDGVYSHGINRVPRFVDFVNKGWVDIDAEPALVGRRVCAESYDGNMGIGITNAVFCMDRAIGLSKKYGLGIVALKNTTHWMRGGTYAWQAVNAGQLAVCWTNTESCIPAWGAKSLSIGNNPFCIGIPDENGPIVLDMAMSQFSYGKMEVAKLAGKQMPIDAGYDMDGNLSRDPSVVLESRRLLPTGFWKGSGMAIAIDLLAALLSGGRSTAEIDTVGYGACGGCSQIFMAFDPLLFGCAESAQASIDATKQKLAQAEPAIEGNTVRYPGMSTLNIRKENNEKGIPVDENIWNEILALAQYV